MARSYRDSVGSIAQEIKDNLPDPKDKARDDRVHEDVDGSDWIIYTANHETVIAESKNTAVKDDVLTMSGDSDDWRKLRQVEAYLVMVKDVQDELRKLDIRYPYIPPPFEAGDRIRLVEMAPRRTGRTLPPGVEGNVTELASEITELAVHQIWKIKVRWDNGARQILSIPPDEAELA